MTRSLRAQRGQLSRGAQLLRTWREAEGMTQRELAIRLGCSFVQMCDYESGKRRPGVVRLYEIWKLTSIRMEDWLERDFEIERYTYGRRLID